MTVGSWQPDSKPISIPTKAIQYALTQDLENFPVEAPEQLASLQPFMKSTAEQWQPMLDSLSDDELKTLCRFFTLAEATWADWYAGKQNPVIWMCKILKNRGAFPDKELTRWIKQNTKNRFLPYGNALG
ncbi:MAG: hypothetical protein P8X74_10825 [Reinekea sp.]|jgi:hypothetical protein